MANVECHQIFPRGGIYFHMGEDEKLFTFKGGKVDGIFHIFFIDRSMPFTRVNHRKMTNIPIVSFIFIPTHLTVFYFHLAPLSQVSFQHVSRSTNGMVDSLAKQGVDCLSSLSALVV